MKINITMCLHKITLRSVFDPCNFFLSSDFMKNHLEIASFESLCYKNVAFELFSKTNFESSWGY